MSYLIWDVSFGALQLHIIRGTPRILSSFFLTQGANLITFIHFLHRVL